MVVLDSLRPLLTRTAMVLLPRAAVTMTAAGAGIGWESNIIDLRGALPVSIERQYQTSPEGQVEGMVWHHTATSGQTLRSIAEYHVQVKHWPGIAYHYAIGHDGRVYMMNDPTTRSYHTQGWNSRTISVVLVGNYQVATPSPAMMRSAADLSAYLRERYELQYSIMHRQTKPTLCPGDNAAALLRRILFGHPKKASWLPRRASTTSPHTTA